VSAVQTILRFMEENPALDYGTPGALVHFVETFSGYDEELYASLARRPTEHTVWMVAAALAGGIVGALILIAAYFVGVALVGAALGAVLVHVIAAQLAREPHPVVVIMGTVAGAVAAMALQRYVIIVATAFGGAWTALVGAISMIGSRAAQVTDGWVLYPLRVPVGHEWMWVGWIVLGGIGAAVQLSNRPRTAKR